MRLKRFMAFVFVLLAFPVSSTAQRRLSLDDCIRMAVEANPELKNSRLEIRVKRNDYVAAIGEVVPEVRAETRFGKKFGRTADPATNLFATNDFVEGSLSLNVSVPLFEGFTRMNKILLQKINRQASEWMAVYNENQMAFDVMDAFYRALFQEQLLVLAVEQRQLSERYLQQAEEFVGEGLKAAVDLQEMKARVSSDIYQESVRRGAGRLAMLELKQLIWVGAEDSVQLAEPDEKSPCPEIRRAQAVYDEAVHFLPQFRLMELKARAAKKSAAIAGGRFAPALRGEIGVYSGCYDSELDGQGKAVAYGRQLDHNLNKYFGVTLSLPVVSGFRNLTGLRKARLQQEQTQNNIRTEQRQLFAEIEDACLSLQAAADELRCAGELLQAEKLALQQAEEKWKEGLVSVFELTESRNRYFTARSEVVRTQLQYGIKRKTADFFRGVPLAGVPW